MQVDAHSPAGGRQVCRAAKTILKGKRSGRRRRKAAGHQEAYRHTRTIALCHRGEDGAAPTCKSTHTRKDGNLSGSALWLWPLIKKHLKPTGPHFQGAASEALGKRAGEFLRGGGGGRTFSPRWGSWPSCHRFEPGHNRRANDSVSRPHESVDQRRRALAPHMQESLHT